MKRSARKPPARKGTAPALPSGYAPFLQAVNEIWNSGKTEGAVFSSPDFLSPKPP